MPKFTLKQKAQHWGSSLIKATRFKGYLALDSAGTKWNQIDQINTHVRASEYLSFFVENTGWTSPCFSPRRSLLCPERGWGVLRPGDVPGHLRRHFTPSTQSNIIWLYRIHCIPAFKIPAFGSEGGSVDTRQQRHVGNPHTTNIFYRHGSPTGVILNPRGNNCKKQQS